MTDIEFIKNTENDHIIMQYSIRFSKNKKYKDTLISRDILNDFLLKFKEELQRDEWDLIFYKLQHGLVPSYSTHDMQRLIYTLLYLNFNFLPYLHKLPKIVFEGMPFLLSIYIPHTMTEIEENAFYACTSLKNVYISSSVIGIGGDVFIGCYMLKHVYVSKRSSLRITSDSKRSMGIYESVKVVVTNAVI